MVAMVSFGDYFGWAGGMGKNNQSPELAHGPNATDIVCPAVPFEFGDA